MTRRELLKHGALASFAAFTSRSWLGRALAQSDYPTKPVRLVVDSAVGSANDATARILADKLGQIWNQQVVVLNQPGAGGAISARVAAQSSPDGFTLYMPATSVFLALPGGPGVAPNLPIELPRDFAAIGLVLQQPIFIAASPKSGINSIADLIARAKEKPNELSYAATGRGRLTHLTMELLQERAAVKLRLVPYAGGPAQAMGDVIADRVDLVLDAYAGLAGAMQGGLVKMLASTSTQRLPGMESLPTVAETLPDFFVGAWNVMVAPNGTPDSIIRKVNSDLRIAVEDKEV
jgi:tripartite-type tricarboxylate transporter receptor subunit TctC